MQSHDGDVELSVTLSTKGLKSDAQKIKSDIEKQFKDSLAFKPTIDDKALQQELNRINRNGKNTIELTPEVDMKKLEQVNKLFERITGIDEAAGWDASTDSINNYLSAYLQLSHVEMDAHRQWVTDNAELIQNNDKAKESINAIRQAIDDISNEKFEVTPEVTADVQAEIEADVVVLDAQVNDALDSADAVVKPGVEVDPNAVDEAIADAGTPQVKADVYIEDEAVDTALNKGTHKVKAGVEIDGSDIQKQLDSLDLTLDVGVNVRKGKGKGSVDSVLDESVSAEARSLIDRVTGNIPLPSSEDYRPFWDAWWQAFDNASQKVQEEVKRLLPSMFSSLKSDTKVEESIEEPIKEAVSDGIENGLTEPIDEGKVADAVKEPINNGVKEGVQEGVSDGIEDIDLKSLELKILKETLSSLQVEELSKEFADVGNTGEEAGHKISDAFQEFRDKFNETGVYTEKMEELKAEAKAAYEELQKMQGGFEYSAKYKEILDLIDTTEQKISKANKELEYMIHNGEENSDKFKDIKKDVENLEYTLKGARDELAQMAEEGTKWEIGVDEEAMERTQQRYDALVQKQALLNQAVRMGSDAWNELEPKERLTAFVENLKLGWANIGKIVTEKVLPAVKKFATSMAKAVGAGIKRGLSAVANGFKKIGERVKGVINHFKEAGKHAGQAFNLKQILAYALGIRGLFSVISKLKEAIKEGVKNVAQWNNGNNKTNESLSMLMTSLAQMKNALGSAFAPIITVVAPILNQLIELVTRAANAVAQFVALISGQSTWLRAKKNAQDYAKSLNGVGGAADKASGKLAAFDDLNVLGKDDESGGGGGGGGINPNDMFEEVAVEPWVSEWLDKLKEMWENADFTELGAIVGEWLKNALDSIPWDKIKEVVAKIAKSIATFLNGFFEVEGLGESIGRTLAEVINTAFTFLYTFLTEMHWDSLGKFIGEALLSAVNTIDAELIGNTIAEKWKAVIDVLYNVLKTFTDGDGFKTLGTKIATTINTFFENMGTVDPEVGLNAWQKIGESFEMGVSGLLETITTALEETDWTQIGQAIYDCITSINWYGLGIDITDCAYAILDSLIDIVDSLPIEEVGESIMDLIEGIDWKGIAVDLSILADSIFTALHDAFKSINWFKLGAAIGDFIAGIDWLGLAWDLWTFFWDAVFAVLGTFVGILASIGKAILEGIMEGISNAASWLKGRWDAFWEMVIGWFKTLFGIHSPSTLFADFGKMIIEGLINGIKAVVQGLYTLWTTIKETIVNIVTALWNKIVEIWNAIWDGITTVVNAIWETITTIWNGIKDTVEDVVTKLWGRITATWTKVHDDVVFWWGKVKHEVVSKVLEIKTNAENKVAELRDKIVEKWEALREKTAEKFKKIKEAIIKAWENVKEGIKKPINGILTFIESMINKIIDGINWFIQKLNSIKMEVVNPFNTSEKYTLGFDLEPLENISIPRLAQGAVIPPNNQFLAMLGDQKHGTNIEAPLDTIKEAFADVVGNLNVQNTGSAVMQVDGRTFARLMTPYVVSELERRGYNVAIMEA